MRFLNAFRKFLEIFCGILLILITIITFAQVVNRYVFNSSFTWAEEVSIYMLTWLSFVGASVGILRNQNIRIDFFVKLIPGKSQYFVDAIAQLLCAGFMVIVTRFAWTLVVINASNLSAGMRIPIGFLYSSGFVCGILMVIFFLIQAGVFFGKGLRQGGNTK